MNPKFATFLVSTNQYFELSPKDTANKYRSFYFLNQFIEHNKLTGVNQSVKNVIWKMYMIVCLNKNVILPLQAMQ